MTVGQPPFSLERPTFRFVRLAMQAGTAPVGGRREVAMAALLMARLTLGMDPAFELSSADREARARAARSWLGSLALSVAVRGAFADLAIATAGTRSEALASLRRVIAVTAPSLDPGARSELESLAASLEQPALQPIAPS